MIQRGAGFTYVHAGPDPGSPEGRQVVAQLLHDAPPEAVVTLAYVMPPGPRPHHKHTSDIAIYVLDGGVSLGFGDDYRNRVEVGAGDYILVDGDAPHAEHVWPGGCRALIALREQFCTLNVG
jgi:anti-sigma factor ChrR (cupin superfamily)